jgi:hypothetical protein
MRNDQFIEETQNLDPNSEEFISMFQKKKKSLADSKIKRIFVKYRSIQKAQQKSLENISDIKGCQPAVQQEIVISTATSSTAVQQESKNDSDEDCFDLNEENDHQTTYAIYINNQMISCGDYEEVVDIESQQREVIFEEAQIMEDPIAIMEYWPTTCERISPAFCDYLWKYITSVHWDEGTQFPPESSEEGSKWNMIDYHKFLRDICEICQSRIHKKGFFLRENFILNQGDVFMYSGKLFHTACDDGFEACVMRCE